MNDTLSAAGNPQSHSNSGLPERVEITTGIEPKNAVIWLHGLGADGHDFEPVVPLLGMDRVSATRFIFPHAPVQSVTMNGGMHMRAWYDIKSISTSRDQDEAGIAQSAALVKRFIARENSRGIPASRIVLAGFSQGGAIAAYAGLRNPEKLAGLLILSAYLLFPDRLDAEFDSANATTPVFVGHGSADPVVPVGMGRELKAHFDQLNLALEYHEYSMPHSVSQEEIVDIGNWLARVLD